MERDTLAPGSAEDKAKEQEMAVLFETIDNATKLSGKFEPIEGARFTEAFWQVLVTKDDPLDNTRLLDMHDHWEEVPTA